MVPVEFKINKIEAARIKPLMRFDVSALHGHRHTNADSMTNIPFLVRSRPAA
jgi:hypothetical protein